ncbi:MAG TPA: mannitol-1-phosphate 5-dehydrogenase [Phycisphaerae bacterium]|nr:mannitol-1-phosphate 5-dehydrogenase [Phycisphaerae bacterium]
MRTLLQFGAGRIGRSLVGALFSRAGYEVLFVDTDARLIDALNARREYLIRVKDVLPPGAPAEIHVRNVRGLAASDIEVVSAAVAEADLIGTAVGAAALSALFPVLARGLRRRRRPVSIILCENLRHAARLVREGLEPRLPAGFDFEHLVGLVETSIGKMVPILPPEVSQHDPLEVWAEAYNQIIADRQGIRGEPPEVEGLVLKSNFPAYVDRKLFIHNLGHAAAAYHGSLAGKETIWECVAEERIRAETRAAMGESAWALAREYPGEFTEADLAAHADDLLRRFDNRVLGDTVYRVGADLFRKLGPDDRLIGAMRLVAAHGGRPEHIARAVAAALRFKAVGPDGRMLPRDEEFHRMLEARGPKATLREVSGLDPGVPGDAALVDLVLRAYGSGV